jgi:hypothetical protein
MSRRELKTITRRLQRGRLASVKEGKYCGSRHPYGYRRKKLEGQKGWTLEIFPEQAEVVRTIFELYTEGEDQPDGSKQRLGTGVIARRLNQLKIPPQVGDYWTPHSIKEMLINPLYIGKVRWNYRKTVRRMVDGKLVESHPRSADENHTIVQGLHEPIVDAATYEKTQEIIKSAPPRPTNDRTVLKNPLAKILKCGVCGRTMARRVDVYGKAKYQPMIYCPLPECNNVGAYLENIENRILEALEEWLAGYRLQWSGDAADKTNSAQADLKQKALKKLEEELAALAKQRGNIYDNLERGIYDTETFLERSRDVGTRIQQTQEDHAALLADLKIRDEQDAAQTLIIPKVEHIIEVYKTLPDAQSKNDLLKEILEKVVYTKTKSTRWQESADEYELILYPKLPHKTPV